MKIVLMSLAAILLIWAAGCGWILGMEKGDLGLGDGHADGNDLIDRLDGIDQQDMDSFAEDVSDLPTECDTDEDCDDGLPCNGYEVCNFMGSCEYGTPLADGTACTVSTIVHGFCQDGVCIPQTCGDGITDPGEECDDGNDVQDDGCRSNCFFSCHLNWECNDDNGCTTDLCEVQGNVKVCNHYNSSDPCDDEDVCTREDKCQGGECAGGIPINCDDDNACTEDALCDPAGGCVNENLEDGTGCSDANPCTSPDECQGGECIAGDSVCDCSVEPCSTHDDGNPCNGTLVCVGSDCVIQLLIEPCPTDADTECVKNRCINDPDNPENPDGFFCELRNEAEATPCNDDSACTINDACTADGECTGTELVCDDHNPCTDDACDPALGCRHEYTTDDCSDGLFCTIIDTCNGAGECVGTLRPCSDEEECTVDFCDEITDSCNFISLPDLTPCGREGDNYCCLAGLCQPCEPPG